MGFLTSMLPKKEHQNGGRKKRISKAYWVNALRKEKQVCLVYSKRISESKKVSVFDVKNKHPSPGNYEVPSYTVTHSHQIDSKY